MKLTKSQNNKRKNDSVQSVLIPKYYGLENVCDVIKKLGYNCTYIDEDKNYFRVRQFNPGSFRAEPRYATVNEKKYKDILLVIEY